MAGQMVPVRTAATSLDGTPSGADEWFVFMARRQQCPRTSRGKGLMGNVRSCTGAGATETGTGRAGGQRHRSPRSCPFPVFMACRRMAEERGFRHPCQSRAPSSLQTGSKSGSPLAPTSLGGAPAAQAAFVPPVSGSARGGAGPPSPLALGRSPSRGPAGAAPGTDTQSRSPRPRWRLPLPERRSRQSVPVLPAPAAPERLSPERWSIRTHFQSHGS